MITQAILDRLSYEIEISMSFAFAALPSVLQTAKFAMCKCLVDLQ